MAQGRMGISVALLCALAGSAAAQPAFPGGAGPMPVAPVPPGPISPPLMPAGGPPTGTSSAASTSPPAMMPPAAPPSSGPTAGFAEDHGPLKVLPGGLPELVPQPDRHEVGDHDIPEYLTPFAPGHSGWYANGEYLMMRARNNDMDYAIVGQNLGLGTVGPVNTLNYQLSSGLRTEVGYRFGPQGKWEAAFEYTYFGDRGGATAAAGPGNVLFPTLTRPGLTDTALTANVNANLDYQVFDLVIGRRVVVDENLAFRGIGGFRFADIRQNFNANYNGADANQDAVSTRSRFQGFGPIVGVESVLGGWCGLHMYTRATVGLVSGLNSNPLIETNDLGSTTYVNTTYNVRKVVPVGTFAIGGGWEYHTFWIRAGYEITQWNGIFDRPRFTDSIAQGKLVNQTSNLTLEGLFIQVGLNF